MTDGMMRMYPRKKALFSRFRRLPLLLLPLMLALGSCAYYNTMFNAKRSYRQGLEELRKAEGQGMRTTQSYKRYFETTIDKCWKLIEIYSDKSKWADDALMYIVRSEFHLGKFAQAKQHLDQFFRKYPKSNLIPEANLWYAKILLKENKEEEANQYFFRVINTARDSQLRSAANFELGLYAYENEDYSRAIDFLEKALKEKIEDEYRAQVLFYLGQSYFIQGNYREAIEQFKKVEKFSPTPDIEYRSKLNLAISYRYLGKYKEAHKILRKMLTAPRFRDYLPTIKATIGETYEMEGRLDEAVDIYKEVVSLARNHPGAAQAAFNLAKLYETTFHNVDSAVTYYGKVELAYGKYDSVEIAREKQKFLSELKELRDKIRYDAYLVDRITHDPAFRDSLLQAQYEDSLRQLYGADYAGGTYPGETADTTVFPGDTLFPTGMTPSDTTAQPEDTTAADSLNPEENKPSEEELLSFRRPLTEEEEKEKAEKEKKEREAREAAQQQKPVERRKLPQIEFDLMNSRYQLAEYFLLKMENLDSAAYHYRKFLETYEDSVLSPKALYSLSYIYRQPGFEQPARADSLEDIILERYPESPFAEAIRRRRGMIVEEKTPTLTPEERAHQLFLKAESLYFAGNIPRALKTYKTVAGLDTTWEICAKAQYAVAWIYEFDLANTDSAVAAYERLRDRYPAFREYVRIAQRKLTPPAPESPSVPDTSLAGTTPQPSPGDKVSPPSADEGEHRDTAFDILEEKIRWRNSRGRQP